MDDPNAYIDIPQALGRLDQPSLTKPEQRLRSLQPETLNLQILKPLDACYFLIVDGCSHL